MQRVWAWLSETKNQKTLAFMGSALAISIGAGWTIYQEFFKSAPPSPVGVVENACGVGVGGRDVVISGINCNFGITLAEYQEALARREEALRAEFEAASPDPARQLLLQQDLENVRKRLENVEASFEERSSVFFELARSLQETPPQPAVTDSFEKAIATGDTQELERRLRADLDVEQRGFAARAYQLGLLLQQNGQIAEAYDLFRRAATAAPGELKYQEAATQLSGQLDVLLGKGRLRVSAVLADGGLPVSARHFVFEAEADLDGNRKRLDYRDGTAIWFELPAGEYWIVSHADHAEAGRKVKVTAASEQNLVITLNAGRLRQSAVMAAGQSPVHARHAVYRPEQDLDGNRQRIDYRDGEAQWFTLPAGTYWIASSADHAFAAREVEIVAGRDSDVVIDLNAGRLRLSAVLDQGQLPVHARHAVYHPDQDLDGNRQRIDYRDGEAQWFTLPAGRYHVTAQTDLVSGGQSVEVVAGEDRDVVTDLEAGRLRVSAVLGGGGEAVEGRHSVYLPEQDLDGNRRRLDYRDGMASWFTLPAGEYFIYSSVDLAQAGRLVEVRAGQDTDAVVDLQAGRLRVAAKAPDGSPVDARHSLYTAEVNLDGQRQRLDYRDGQVRWFTLPAGAYYIQSGAGNLLAERQVVVTANETVNLELSLTERP